MHKTEELDNCTRRLRTDFNIVPDTDKVMDTKESLSANLRSQDDEVSSGNPQSVALGPSITPPTSLITPPEYVPAVTYNPQFLKDFMGAYAVSRYGHALRVQMYGADVANEYRRGFTPEDARKQWELVAERQRIDAETLSDSEG